MNGIQTLSIVMIAPKQYAKDLNELAELLGMGPDNLSICLQDSAGQLFYGGHSWWTQEKYNTFKNYGVLIEMGIDVSRYIHAINALFDAIVDTSGIHDEELYAISLNNLNTSLELLGLTRIEAEV